MALPGYATEASLYRTGRSYRGASSLANDSGLAVVAQQIPCDVLCAIRWQVCNIGWRHKHRPVGAPLSGRLRCSVRRLPERLPVRWWRWRSPSMLSTGPDMQMWRPVCDKSQWNYILR
jgi:hypothetical protein